MERAARIEQVRPKTTATPAPRRETLTATERDILALQRSAGNRAVTQALTNVQRHSLDPESMDQG
jgi:hypothetical protein